MIDSGISDYQNKVSVIIPTYNRSTYVTEAIESVLQQTYENFEVIVVDDGSTDDTGNVLEKYRGRICHLYQRNAGVSNARNAGLRAASGGWVAFLDSDDVWLPHKLSVQMADIVRNNDLCAHISNVSVVKVNGDYSDHFKIDKNDSDRCFIFENLIHHILRYHIFLTGAVFRKKSVIDAGLFDEKLKVWEDFDFALRMTQEGPWFVSDVVLSRVIRRDEPPIDITHTITSDRLFSNAVLIEILNKYKKKYISTLNDISVQLMNRKIGSLYYDIATELLLTNDKTFRNNLVKAMSVDNSLKSFIKCAFLFIFGKFGTNILRGSQVPRR